MVGETVPGLQLHFLFPKILDEYYTRLLVTIPFCGN
jgi:hypothetical protein